MGAALTAPCVGAVELTDGWPPGFGSSFAGSLSPASLISASQPGNRRGVPEQPA